MKYRNVKTGGYDSRKEAKRAAELKIMEKAGLISKLQEQVPFVIIPKQQGEREAKYIADFCYFEGDKMVAEDVKGVRTREYILKRKLMMFRHGIQIREI